MDDRPFGGGEGMVLKPEPIFEAVESIWPERAPGQQKKVVLLSAQGRRFDQAVARRIARGSNELLLICGRYEGVDERVAEHLADEELSVGDFVLSGGELAAAVVIDVIARRSPECWETRLRRCRSRSAERGTGAAGLPAVYAAGGISRLEGSGSAAQRESRADPAVAAEGGGGKNRRMRPDLLEGENTEDRRKKTEDGTEI